MTVALKLLQKVTAETTIEDKADAREDKAAAIANQRDAIDEIHAQRCKKAQEEADAIRAEFGGRFWGTIIGGPLVGTLIGWGIGAAVSNGHDDAAAAAGKRAGLADLERATGNDDMQDAAESVDNANQRGDQVDKFMDEIRQHEDEINRI
jgi:hypothetical protein